MNIKRTPLKTRNEDSIDLDNVKDYPTLADLMREQNISTDNEKTVHFRRDLDSLG